MSFILKNKIDSAKVRFFSTLGIGIVSVLLVFLLTNIVMQRAEKYAEMRYLQNCQGVVDGYSNAIYYYLENYHTSLSSVFNEELFKTEDGKKIQKWLIDNQPFIHKDLCATFFITKDGTAYFSEGSVIDVSDKPYYTAAKTNKTDFYISNINYSSYANALVVILQEPVWDGNEFIGVLCGSIKLDKFQQITNKLKIGESGTAFLLDRNGKFIASPNVSLVGKTFTPLEDKYKGTSTDIISASEPGIVETVNAAGEPVTLFYEKIQGVEWTLTVGFLKTDLVRLKKNQRYIKLVVVLISIVALAIMLFLESLTIDRFYKKQQVSMSYDSLTNLWTRQKFEAVATRMIRHHPNQKYMLVESDIRGFKFINQNYGSEAADKIIFFYSTFLNKLTAENHGILGRGYADRFYSLFKITSVRSAMSVFQKENQKLNEQIKNGSIPFFPKFGITFFHPKEEKHVSLKDLIGQASFAKSTIKDNMITQYAIYNSRMVEKIKEENFMEQNVEKALEKGEFFVMYQPKISLSTDKVVGAEALVRWQSPEHGLIMPNKFIPCFEKNGFIQKLDFYVYKQVFEFLDKQIKNKSKVVPISVNMSRNHNKPEKFVNDFMRSFKKYKIPSNLIQVEIIERSVMDYDTLRDITERLHKEGFTVAMDDFGSGESSLNMLTKIPVDVLKFDREFLLSSTKDNGELDEKSAKFISILIDLSKHLEKETVFEGVETKIQRDFLRSINCDQAQGFFYSKPLSEEDFVNFLKDH